MKLFGHTIEVVEVMACERGGDGNTVHRQLLADARLDCINNQKVSPDDRYALCGRCGKLVSLKI
jgi:hypothetical protein